MIYWWKRREVDQGPYMTPFRVMRRLMELRRSRFPDDDLEEDRVVNLNGMMRVAFHFVYKNKVEGDYLEFGVWQGRSFKSAWRHSQRYLPEVRRHFYLFDSFQGLPAPSGPDAGDIFQGGDYSTSYDEFLALADRAGITRSDYSCIPGWFRETLTESLRSRLPLKKAAIVYIDCDLWESTRFVLAWVRPYLQGGTIVCFDDYFCFKGNPMKGEQRAIREFLGLHSDITFVDYHLFGWHGKSFIVHLRGEDEENLISLGPGSMRQQREAQ